MIWLDTVVQGVLLGGLYALFAAGLSLVFGIMRLVNIAYGELVMAGGYTLAFTTSWPLAVRLLATFADSHAGAPPAQPIEPLTSREEEVLIPVAQGRTNSEIADALYISISTVKTHLASLMRKLGARNRVEIAMWAYETGRIKS